MFAGDELCYSELVELLEGRALALAEHGVSPGDRVALFAPNSREFYEASFVAAALGAILVPLNLRLSGHELRAVLEDSRPVLLLLGSA